jgi:uncharacterized membrane protein
MIRLIEKLLIHYHKIVYSLISGLLSGSVGVLLMNPIVYQSGISAVIITAGRLRKLGSIPVKDNLFFSVQRVQISCGVQVSY